MIEGPEVKVDEEIKGYLWERCFLEAENLTNNGILERQNMLLFKGRKGFYIDKSLIINKMRF